MRIEVSKDNTIVGMLAPRMPVLFLGFAILFQFATDCSAEEWSIGQGEYRLNFEEASNLTSIGALKFPGFGQSLYSGDGSYSFIDETKSVRRLGIFEVQKDGKVCIDYGGKSRQCDVFIRRDGLYFLLTPDGNRFPIFFGLEKP